MRGELIISACMLAASVPLFFVACTKAPANPVDEPLVEPMNTSIRIYEDRYARCYQSNSTGYALSCIPKVQEKN